MLLILVSVALKKWCLFWRSVYINVYNELYRRWGDKTSYLKYVKCSGEPKKHGGFNTITNGTAFYMYLPCHSGSIFQIEICNLDRTKSSFLATSLYKKVIFTKNWVTRSCRSDDMHISTNKNKYLHSDMIPYLLPVLLKANRVGSTGKQTHLEIDLLQI